MWLRARFDIPWSDLAAAFIYCLTPCSRNRAEQETLQAWSQRENVLATLSVRSGFDLLLSALNLPPQSEILFSAITQPDMVRIAKNHGLRVVSVDVDQRGEIDLDALQQKLSERTRVLVVAHLFGNRSRLRAVREAFAARDILIVEDAAQGLVEIGGGLDEASDVIMHSFGPIKTATALGGGIVEVRDKQLFQAMQAILAQQPTGTRIAFLKRVCRFSLLKCLTLRPVSYSLFKAFLCLHIDPDHVLSRLGRGFSTGNLTAQLRYRPSASLLRLMARRFRRFDQARIARRTCLGHHLCAVIGRDCSESDTFWAFPLLAANVTQVVSVMRQHGFDATAVTRMEVVTDMRTPLPAKALAFWRQAVFIPCCPEIFSERKRLEVCLRKLRDAALLLPQCESESHLGRI